MRETVLPNDEGYWTENAQVFGQRDVTVLDYSLDEENGVIEWLYHDVTFELSPGELFIGVTLLDGFFQAENYYARRGYLPILFVALLFSITFMSNVLTSTVSLVKRELLDEEERRTLEACFAKRTLGMLLRSSPSLSDGGGFSESSESSENSNNARLDSSSLLNVWTRCLRLETFSSRVLHYVCAIGTVRAINSHAARRINAVFQHIVTMDAHRITESLKSCFVTFAFRLIVDARLETFPVFLTLSFFLTQ